MICDLSQKVVNWCEEYNWCDGFVIFFPSQEGNWKTLRTCDSNLESKILKDVFVPWLFKLVLNHVEQ